MGEFDMNPDIDEKPPMSLRDALEKVKPFLMAYEGIQSQEEWEVCVLASANFTRCWFIFAYQFLIGVDLLFSSESLFYPYPTSPHTHTKCQW